MSKKMKQNLIIKERNKGKRLKFQQHSLYLAYWEIPNCSSGLFFWGTSSNYTSNFSTRIFTEDTRIRPQTTVQFISLCIVLEARRYMLVNFERLPLLQSDSLRSDFLQREDSMCIEKLHTIAFPNLVSFAILLWLLTYDNSKAATSIS